MKKVLMVCLGNICRSPMAEGILRHIADQHRLNLQIDSAGTGNYHVGEAPDHRAIKAMRNYGIDISGLRARQLSKSDFDEFDYIFVMDRSNLANSLKLTSDPEHHHKISLIMNKVSPGSDEEVPDPWFGGEEGFELVYSMLNDAANRIITDLKEENTSTKKTGNSAS